MSELFAALGYLAAALFAVAAMMKVRDPSAFRAQLADYKLVPAALLWPLGIAIPVAELAGATLAMWGTTRLAGLLALLALLAIFTAVVVRSLLAGLTTVRCACFGRASQTLDWTVVTRNGLLGGALLAAAIADRGADLVGFTGAVLALTLAWVLVEVQRSPIYRLRSGATAPAR